MLAYGPPLGPILKRTCAVLVRLVGCTTNTYIYIFFSPVNPESGIIQSGLLNYSNIEYSNISGKELNVTDITEQQFL